MLLNPSTPLPPRKILYEHVAQTTGEISFPLELNSLQITLGVRLYINGLQQTDDAFTATGSSIILPEDLEVTTGDVIHVEHFKAV